MKPSLCVFNCNRESFLGLRVAAADTMLRRLKGALGKLAMQPNDGLWVTPSHGIHTIGMLFAIDLIYLDSSFRVIHLVEHLGPFRIAPFKMKCASVLELRSRTIYASNTTIGDELLICTPEEMTRHCERNGSRLVFTAGVRDRG